MSSAPPAGRRVASRCRKVSSISRRPRWSFFGQGSGKLIVTPATSPGRQSACRAAAASPCSKRTLSRPARSTLRTAWRSAGSEISMPSTLSAGCVWARRMRNSPLPKPISTRSGAGRPKSVGHSVGQGNCSTLYQSARDIGPLYDTLTGGQARWGAGAQGRAKIRSSHPQMRTAGMHAMRAHLRTRTPPLPHSPAPLLSMLAPPYIMSHNTPSA